MVELTGRVALVCVVAAALFGLSGCITVSGNGARGQYAPSGASRPAGASDSLGLARPFLPLPSVVPAAVPDRYDPAADSKVALSAALATARTDGRPVLVEFGSDWCEDCRALSALVDTPGVNLILSRNYHLVTVDVGHFDRNTQLAATYVTLGRSGIPALVLLAPDGSIRRPAEDGQFANARALTSDQLANTLVDWLYPMQSGSG
ncbi:thiol:disulfide interchange protein [Streptacidiphilus sp. MAP12-16]|uniref:thioredoxin family protein n=1 Tax=Streptacidiphilus sp. MAP12-16 TaxID=3156300 RepID=UPI00351909AB